MAAVSVANRRGPAEHLGNHTTCRLGMRRIDANGNRHLVSMPDHPGIDIFQLDRTSEIAPVRLEKPTIVELAQRSDGASVGPLQDFDDLPREPIGVFGGTPPRDPGHDAVARHGTARRLGGDEDIPLSRKLLR